MRWLLLLSCVKSCLWRPHRQQPTRVLCPWDSPGKNTGVGCHFILQRMHACMHAKSLQLCPTLCDPIDGSPPGSSLPGILQAKTLAWVAISFSNACIHAYQVASAMSDSVRTHRWQPTRLLCPWDSPGKNTGVDCHFLLHFLNIVNLQFCVSGIQQFTR